MPTCENLKPDGRFFGLFMGPSKAGKTVAACSFLSEEAIKQERRIKVFDFDGGIQGISSIPWLSGHKKLIDYEYYPPRVQAGQVPTYQKINNDLEALMVNCATGKNLYETIILDSLTSQTFAMLCDSVSLTHGGEGRNKGKRIGTMMMPGPEDYGFEAVNTYNILSFFRSLNVRNVIITAHIVDRYGRPPGNDDPFAERIVIGEKLSIRDKIGENVGIYFNHKFRFDVEMRGTEKRHNVQFHSELASTSFFGLPNGKIDITGKNFYSYLMGLVNKT